MLIGIIGGSGSGKTTVAKKLARLLADHCTLINMDNYYVDLPPGIQPQEFNFDSPAAFDFELFETDLKKLKNGEGIKIPDYSFITYRREPGIFTDVLPSDVIIVEGLFVLYKQSIRDLFDLSVYVETPDDERLLRRIERDMMERQRSISSIIKQYRGFVAPAFRSFVEPQKYYADIILPEGGYNEVGMEIIYGAISRKIENGKNGE